MILFLPLVTNLVRFNTLDGDMSTHGYKRGWYGWYVTSITSAMVTVERPVGVRAISGALGD